MTTLAAALAAAALALAIAAAALAACDERRVLALQIQ